MSDMPPPSNGQLELPVDDDMPEARSEYALPDLKNPDDLPTPSPQGLANTKRELGSIGTKQYGGVTLEEFLPALRGEDGRKIFREMYSNEAIISGAMMVFEGVYSKAHPTIRTRKGMEKSQEAKDVAEFVQSCFEDLNVPFSYFMSSLASKFIFGWSVHEIVYKERNGANFRNPDKHSKWNDGRIGWSKFAIREQDTLWDWVFNKQGEMLAFQQWDPWFNQTGIPYRRVRGAATNETEAGQRGYHINTIPVNKILHFTTTKKTGNPEGQSILRGAYRSWYFKKRIEEIEALGIERELAGLPMIKAPADLFLSSATASQKQFLQTLKDTVQNIRRDAQDGLVFPVQYDENNNSLYEFELVSSGGRRQISTDDIIKRKNMEMAMSMMADFMLLGHENVGTFALSEDKTNIFSMIIDGHLHMDAQTLQEQAIPRLLALNGIPLELAPDVGFNPVSAPTLPEISEYIQRLARAGAPFFPDDRLQGWLHEQVGMPPPEKTSEDRLHAEIQPGEDQTTDPTPDMAERMPEGDEEDEGGNVEAVEEIPDGTSSSLLDVE